MRPCPPSSFVVLVDLSRTSLSLSLADLQDCILAWNSYSYYTQGFLATTPKPESMLLLLLGV